MRHTIVTMANIAYVTYLEPANTLKVGYSGGAEMEVICKPDKADEIIGAVVTYLDGNRISFISLANEKID